MIWAILGQRHGTKREFPEPGLERLDGLEFAEIIRSQRHDGEERLIIRHGRIEDLKKRWASSGSATPNNSST